MTRRVSYESLFVQNSSCTVLCLVAWQWSCYGGAQSNCQFLSDSAPNYKIHASWAQPRLISLASTGQHCLLWGLGSDLVIILESWSEAVKITNHIWHTTRSLSRISQASFPRQLIGVIPMFMIYRNKTGSRNPIFVIMNGDLSLWLLRSNCCHPVVYNSTSHHIICCYAANTKTLLAAWCLVKLFMIMPDYVDEYLIRRWRLDEVFMMLWCND